MSSVSPAIGRGGFTDEEIEIFQGTFCRLWRWRVSEVRLKRTVSGRCSRAAVGLRAGEQSLAGATTRGSGVTVQTQFLICDLRDFDALGRHSRTR